MKKALIIGAVILVVLIVMDKVRDNDTTLRDASSDPSPEAAAYDCGGERVYADYNNDADPKNVDIYFDEKSQVLTLPQEISASGARYGNDTVTFWDNGDTATFEYEGESLDCTKEEAGLGADAVGGTIPVGCVAWFDGCNNCSVDEEGELVACTMMYCETPTEAYCTEYEDGSSDAPADTAVSVGVAGGLVSATYNIEGEEVILIDGKASVPAAPGSTTMVETNVTEFSAEGDLQQGTGATLDGGIVLMQNPGGSGTFYYIGAVLEQSDASYAATENTVFLGDRITIKDLVIADRVLEVTFLTRGDDQAMNDAPTVEVIRQFATQGDALMEVTHN